MRHYTAEQFREGTHYKTDFYREYSARVYDLAHSHVKDGQASLKITKSVFLKAFQTLSVVDYDGDDYWPFLKGYVLEETAAYLSGRSPRVDAAGPSLYAGAVQAQRAPSVQTAVGARSSAKRIRGAFMFGVNILLCLLLVWLLIGLLIRLGVLPSIDLGYSWFNQYVFLLF